MSEALSQVMERCREAHRELGEICQGLQDTRQQVDAVKERSAAVKQELRETEESLGRLLQTMAASREDLTAQFREASARFLTLGEVCQDLHQELREVYAHAESLRPQPQEEPLVPGIAEPLLEGGAAIVVAEDPTVVLEPPPAGTPAQGSTSEESTTEGKPQLGITVNPGAMVVEVLPETPAEKAGLQRGDVVVGVDGKPISNSEDLRDALEQTDAGQEVHLTVARGLEKEEVKAQLSEAPA
jgi:hypothetical protein